MTNSEIGMVKKNMAVRFLAFSLAIIMMLGAFAVVPVLSVESEPEAEQNNGAQNNSEIVYDEDVLSITVDGEERTELEIYENEKVEIKAEGVLAAKYQWQILHPERSGLWVDIYEETKETLDVSLVLTSNMESEDGKTYLRCVAYEAEGAYVTDVLEVATLEGTKPIDAPEIPKLETGKVDYNLVQADGDDHPEFVTITIEYIQYAYVRQVDGSLVLEEVGQAISPYVASLQAGSEEFYREKPNPTIVGFKSWLAVFDDKGDKILEECPNDTVIIDLREITEDVTYRVEYHPDVVPYEVHYYFQNIYDDLYVEDTVLAPTEYAKGETGREPDASYVQAKIPGFTSLYYEPETIAADGSTVFNVYYERNYYLMEFDCAGGFGTDTIYVRYGTYISVPEPKRAGYEFAGWDIVEHGEDLENQTTESDSEKNDLPTTMPAYHSSYVALWTTIETTYTVVYWAENANDGNYSYWGYQTFVAMSSETRTGLAYSYNSNPAPSGKDAIAVDSQGNLLQEVSNITTQKEYFTFYAAKSDKDVLIKGDGSSIVNVYYTRNYYTLTFEATGECGLNEHSHSSVPKDCEYPLICGNSFKHQSDCDKKLICNETEHIHDKTCCSLEGHHAVGEHKTNGCYKFSTDGTYIISDVATDDDLNDLVPDEYGIAVKDNGCDKDTYYVKLSDGWYAIEGWEDETSVTLVCHPNDGNVCECNLDLTEHQHNDSCYECSCGENAHFHTQICYGNCIKQEHTHDGNCDNSSRNNTVYSITAKYEAEIKDYFPIKNSVGGDYTGYWWDDSTNAVFTAWIASLDTMPGKDIAFEGEYKAKNATIWYYTEVLPGEKYDSDLPGTDDRNYSLYKKVITTQSGYLTTDEEFHNIEGFTKGNYYPNNIFSDTQENNYLYYTRNSYKLKFYSYNAYLTEKETTVLYDAPIKDYYFNNPQYPSTLEPGAYEFAGWYTTAGFYPGTEVKWDEDTMPAKDLILYAKWVPVTHDVYFYYLYSDFEDGDTWDKPTDAGGNEYDVTYPIVVDHGTILGNEFNYYPKRDKYTFVGWFYIDEEGKKRFAPDSMEIRQDLHLFAEWQSGIDTQYEVTYVLKEAGTIKGTNYPAGTEIAKITEGHSTAGKTKTFTAKVLNDLYPAFAEAPLFPTVNSHSILMEESAALNKFEFEYVLDEQVWYKVKYLNKITGAAIHPEKVECTDKAVVTEKFVPIQGYLPEKYYIRKVLASDSDDGSEDNVIEQNEIIFYYSPDDKHGIYTIEFYREKLVWTDDRDSSNDDDEKYELIQSEIASADLLVDGQANVIEVTSDKIKTYNGFTHTHSTITQYEKSGDTYTSAKTTVNQGEEIEGTLSAAGLEFRIYYDRNKYPYIVKFMEYGTTKVLGYGRVDVDAHGNVAVPNMDTKVYSETEIKASTQNLKYEDVLSYTAPDSLTVNGLKYNFLASTDQTKSTNVRTETTSDYTNIDSIKNNILVFYYELRKIPIEYFALCTVPSLGGLNRVSINREDAATTENIDGCDAYAASGFKFVGWYSDPSCKDEFAVDPDWVSKGTYLTPKQLLVIPITEDNPEGANRYYALFEPLYGSLTITKKGVADGDKDNRSFLFKVVGKNNNNKHINMVVSIVGNGSATIEKLPIGEYEVTEITDWSWTYNLVKSPAQPVEVKQDEVATAEFTNSAKDVDWLNGEAEKDNLFKKIN